MEDGGWERKGWGCVSSGREKEELVEKDGKTDGFEETFVRGHLEGRKKWRVVKFSPESKGNLVKEVKSEGKKKKRMIVGNEVAERELKYERKKVLSRRNRKKGCCKNGKET